MTNKKSTKRALLASVMSLLLCVTMLLGTTFAWFTDNASVAVSTVQAGKLDVALEVYENGEWVSAEGKTLEFVKASGAEDEAVLWEPGCTYSLPALRVVNNGDLALKYAVRITGINGDAKLNEAIEWTLGNVGEGQLLAGQFTDDIVIKGHMKETAGNEYQGLTIDGIAVTVFASQLAHESDGNGNDYDANAPFTSFWDGVSVTAPANISANEVHIKSAAEFAWLMKNTRDANSPFIGKTFVLDCNIDFGGRTITGVGSDQCNTAFTFDGNNRTISNFKIDNSREWYTGLFNQVSHGGVIKNLTVENATVIGNKMVGVIASDVENGCTIENCTVKNSTVISKMKKVGAVVGYALSATVKNCEAVDCDVYCADSDVNESGEVIGFVNTGCTVENISATNVTVTRGVSAVSNAAELALALDNAGNAPSYARNIVLLADIDGSEWTAISGGSNYPAVMIDGNGYAIKNLSSCLFDCLPARDYVFKNINFTDVNITDGDCAGLGVIVGEAQSNGGYSYTITNCHIDGGSLYSAPESDAGKYVGGFIGRIDGTPTVTITGCSVTNLEISTFKSAGAFVGFAYGGTLNITVKDCEVKGNTSVTARENRAGSTATAGIVIGTLNNNCNAVIDGCTVENTVTLSNTGAEAVNDGLVGRAINGSTVTVR